MARKVLLNLVVVPLPTAGSRLPVAYCCFIVFIIISLRLRLFFFARFKIEREAVKVVQIRQSINDAANGES